MNTLWFYEIQRMSELFKHANSMHIDTLFSMIQGHIYAEKMITSRNNPEILSYLINNPTVPELHLSLQAAKAHIETLLQKIERILSLLEKHEQHAACYKEIFQSEKQGSKEAQQSDSSQWDCREVYLDNIATTAIRPEVQKRLIDYTQGLYGFGNPSTNTYQGVYASNLLEEARAKIAETLHAESREIFFTSSGTEANNLAIKGIAFQHLQDKGHIITTMMEHPSVLECMKYLETLGFDITYLQPDQYGCIDAFAVEETIRMDTLLVSVMAANNEIGTLYPIKQIGHLCKIHNIPFMVDGVQAFGKLSIDVNAMSLTLFTFSGHKLYGPKGVGGLYVRSNTSLTPQLHGGGQEKGLRSSTENVGHILALGLAAELANKEMKDESHRLHLLREQLLEGLMKIDSEMIVYGAADNKLSGLLSVGFRNANAGFLIRELNHIGISASSGSACSSKKANPSHVMKAIGANTEDVAVIRFGLGLYSNEEDIAYVIKYFGNILLLARELYK